MMSTHRSSLPQLHGELMITDGGLETDLIFHHGIELPHFAAFPLLADSRGTSALRRYYEGYADIARDVGAGLVLETPTWRANPDWAPLLGYTQEDLDGFNRSAVELMREIRADLTGGPDPIVISGCVGPRGDGYVAGEAMDEDAAEAYHRRQIAVFAEAGADLVTAITMTSAAEATGIARAARAEDIPVAISFTVETDGTLPSGESLSAAIEHVDAATVDGPAYFMINCAHPTHFAHALEEGTTWTGRILGLRANASTLSHAELDEAPELDEGDPADLAARHRDLRGALPALTVLGGCCGTDHRHVAAIAAEWTADG